MPAIKMASAKIRRNDYTFMNCNISRGKEQKQTVTQTDYGPESL